MNKSKGIKSIRLSYKISIVSVLTVLVIGFFSVIFLLLPIYSLVGDDNLQDSSEADDKLSRAKFGTSFALVATYILLSVSFVSAGYGVYQDVRKKPKV